MRKQNFKIGQLVWIVSCHHSKDGFKAIVRQRRFDRRIENYLGREGLRYHCTKPELPEFDNAGLPYGMAYEPKNVFETEAHAKIAARNRTREEINKLWALLESLK